MPIPRKMSGSEINVIDPSILAIRMPRVEIVSAIHLYPSGTTIGPVPRSATAPPFTSTAATLNVHVKGGGLSGQIKTQIHPERSRRPLQPPSSSLHRVDHPGLAE